MSFHLALVRLSNNAVLIESFERSRDLFFKVPSYWRVFNQPPRRARRQDAVHRAKFQQYERIVRAVEARDSSAAGRAMFEHLTAVERDLIAHLEQPRANGATSADSRPLAASPSQQQGAHQ